MNATSPRATPIEQVLQLAWIALIAVTAVGHVTALRNALTVLVSVATLAIYRNSLRTLPCKAAIGALAAWAVASLAWSPVPDVTFGKLRTDLLIPLVAGAGAFCFARDARGARFVLIGLVAGLAALGVLSLFAYLPAGMVPASWPLEQSGGIVRPLPHWYPGPGDTSMFAILAIAPLVRAWNVAQRHRASRRVRVGLVAAALLLAFVLVTTNNRNAVLVAPLVVLLQWLLGRRTRVAATPGVARRRRAMLAVAATVVVAAALAAALEFGARERLEYLKKPLVEDSAAVQLVSADTRPMIWRYYLARGSGHPWIGMGFGRTVPGIGWHTESDQALAAVEPNAYIHAHNVLLNWWLQLGLVGLALLAVAIGSVVRAARRLRDRAIDDGDARDVEIALHVTLVATLARNLTDDFLVYGMATAFCVIVGALLGELARRSGEVATSRRSRSAPS